MPKTMKTLGQQIGEVCWYEIDGEPFYQGTLVLGQSARIAPYLHGMSFADLQSETVLNNLGDRLGDVLSIVLIPKGLTPQAHVERLATPGAAQSGEWFLGRLTHVDLLEVIEDFFGCNLDSSLMTRFANGLQGRLSPSTTDSTMNGSAPLSPAAIPPIGAPSLD
ncbi:MAG: hypothetical protein OEQ18_00705 [Gammaproteobacteria bacterium]|nr:hypothetical protein [Gammaproteobacteria bacterium]